MRKAIYAGALALALAAGVAAVSGGLLAAGAAPPQKVAQVSAGQRVATLDLVNVSCATCAPVVTRALSSVPGVANVSVQEGFGATATARIVYDPRRVTPAALAAATTDAGFPARVVTD